jgi:hypothetical protein
MALPQTIRVRLSSEEAGAISITPVVVQELPVREFIEHMLGVTGKDEPRIREVLRRGTLVSGASRFRWPGWEADPQSLVELLATFPDPDPSRPFAAERCVRAVLRGGGRICEITREAGSRKGLLQRASFWNHLMELAGAAPTAYAGYSYKHRADRYFRDLSVAETQRLRDVSDSVRFTTLRDQLRVSAFAQVELFVAR